MRVNKRKVMQNGVEVRRGVNYVTFPLKTALSSFLE